LFWSLLLSIGYPKRREQDDRQGPFADPATSPSLALVKLRAQAPQLKSGQGGFPLCHVPLVWSRADGSLGRAKSPTAAARIRGSSAAGHTLKGSQSSRRVCMTWKANIVAACRRANAIMYVYRFPAAAPAAQASFSGISLEYCRLRAFGSGKLRPRDLRFVMYVFLDLSASGRKMWNGC
jgi:hypothetical protein